MRAFVPSGWASTPTSLLGSRQRHGRGPVRILNDDARRVRIHGRERLVAGVDGIEDELGPLRHISIWWLATTTTDPPLGRFETS
ncbi:MAG TPA: hypothetical protein VIT00_00940 [Terrimicrobiaceae bacterium]